MVLHLIRVLLADLQLESQEEGISQPTSSNPVVSLGTVARGKKRKLTKIAGLSSFTSSMADAAKFFRNRFACGCSVEGDVIEIQGDFLDECADLLQSEFSVPEDSISFESEEDLQKIVQQLSSKPSKNLRKKKKK
ncbi:hypothetical protein GEMRC1_009024 [Eukaryota sp. GEM-RC1]